MKYYEKLKNMNNVSSEMAKRPKEKAIEKAIQKANVDLIVLSSDPGTDYAVRKLWGGPKLDPLTLGEFVTSVKKALDGSNVGYWRTTLEVSLGVGPIGIKGTLEIANQK